MQFALAVSSSVSVSVLSGWLAFAGAGGVMTQTNGQARQREVERTLRALMGESDAAFDALIDPCIVENGRRTCPC